MLDRSLLFESPRMDAMRHALSAAREGASCGEVVGTVNARSGPAVHARTEVRWATSTRRRPQVHVDCRTLARFSFLIPFWALSLRFLRVARDSPGSSGTGPWIH
jgi:hypothetical protein